VFPCAGEDRWISIAVVEDEEWRGLVRAMGDPDWATAPGLAEAAGRIEHLDEIHDKLGAWTQGFDDRELTERLQAEGVAAAPVLNVADLLHDPQYGARNTFVEVEHPLGFRETIYGAYVKTSRSTARIAPGPAMGQDNEHVFTKLLGLSPERYREMIEQEVIF
jgi:benzylsuccinate CoA-transferase BbsF subunit